MRDDAVHHLPGNTVYHRVEHKLRIALASSIAACALALGCSTSTKPLAEAPPPTASVQTDQPVEASKLPPATATDIQAAVQRVFKESVVVDSNHQPAFVTGDFNGDKSEDLAVVLKPDAARISDLNEEYPSWILRDLSATNESRSPRLLVVADDTLLAVIHGHGSNGWRDPQATQTFLLKNAVGSGMKAQSTKDFVTANQGHKMPGLSGDVVAEVLSGRPGYLYFANATYAWYDPKTFTGDLVVRRGHGSAEPMKR